jgi:hypothetical protein
VTDQTLPRKVTLLALMPAEVELVRRALERMPKTNGGGEPQLRKNVLEMLEGSTFTDPELHELSAIGGDQ